MQEQLETKTIEKEDSTTLEGNIKKTKEIEIKLPVETTILVNYKDPITEEYILEHCNTSKDKKACEEMWQQRDRNIHMWM